MILVNSEALTVATTRVVVTWKRGHWDELLPRVTDYVSAPPSNVWRYGCRSHDPPYPAGTVWERPADPGSPASETPTGSSSVPSTERSSSSRPVSGYSSSCPFT
jgi:hypothetical protein